MVNKEIILNEKQIDIMSGAMLGDGCLYLGKKSKNAQFTYTSKSRQHVDFVVRDFMEYSYTEGIKEVNYFDKRTDKTYGRYTFRSQSNISFTKLHEEWYIDRVKHIKNNLKLNSLICLIWYIGDGCLLNGRHCQNIKLSTQGFLKEEIENILIPQLKDFEAKLMKADYSKTQNRQQYFIYIPHRKIKDFLNYIGDCPFDDYKYKWKYREYKNKEPINHTDKEKIFCEMYKSGMTCYSISKVFNIEPNAVKYYLIKNKLYKQR